MNNRVEIRPIDHDVVVAILRLALPVNAQVWIFGSRSRATQKRSADLDIAIDANRPLTEDERLTLDYAFEMSELPYRVDVIDMTAISGIFRDNVERDRIPFQWQA